MFFYDYLQPILAYTITFLFCLTAGSLFVTAVSGISFSKFRTLFYMNIFSALAVALFIYLSAHGKIPVVVKFELFPKATLYLCGFLSFLIVTIIHSFWYFLKEGSRTFERAVMVVFFMNLVELQVFMATLYILQDMDMLLFAKEILSFSLASGIGISAVYLLTSKLAGKDFDVLKTLFLMHLAALLVFMISFITLFFKGVILVHGFKLHHLFFVIMLLLQVLWFHIAHKIMPFWLSAIIIAAMVFMEAGLSLLILKGLHLWF